MMNWIFYKVVMEEFRMNKADKMVENAIGTFSLPWELQQILKLTEKTILFQWLLKNHL